MKVLALHASFGSGHTRAAQAVAEAFQDRDVAVELRDLLEFLPAPMSKFYSNAYDFLITSGRILWRQVYNVVNAPKGPYRPATAVTQKWQFNRLKEFLQHGAFTHVFSTHFTPSALLTDWCATKELQCKCFSIITDYEAHRCWKRTGLDHYFVGSQQVASEIQKVGVPPNDITISGIPISKAFSSPISRAEARKSWNLADHSKVTLVVCSAVSLKKSVRMLNEFSTLDSQVQYMVVAGSDPEKEKELKLKFGKDPRFILFGFTRRMAEMMKAADVIVTKPGGLIVSEALAMGIPQILVDPIPGQEEANARYSVEQGAATCIVPGPGIYEETLKQILLDEAKLKEMTEAARRTGKPEAAQRIAETVLSRFVV